MSEKRKGAGLEPARTMRREKSVVSALNGGRSGETLLQDMNISRREKALVEMVEKLKAEVSLKETALEVYRKRDDLENEVRKHTGAPPVFAPINKAGKEVLPLHENGDGEDEYDKFKYFPRGFKPLGPETIPESSAKAELEKMYDSNDEITQFGREKLARDILSGHVTPKRVHRHHFDPVQHDGQSIVEAIREMQEEAAAAQEPLQHTSHSYVSPFDRMMGDAMGLFFSARNAFSRLEERLKPVLLPIGKASAGEGQPTPAPDPIKSPIEEGFDAMTRQFTRLLEDVEDVSSRLRI